MKINTSNLNLVAFKILPCLLLIACGGGGGGSDTTTEPAPDPQTYLKLSDTTPYATSQLAAFALNEEGSASSPTTQIAAGRYDHGNGTASLDNSQSVTTTNLFQGDYEYVRSYRQDFVQNGVANSITGFYGVTTASADIGRVARAEYTGEAIGKVLSSSETLNITQATAKLTADFTNKRAELTINGISATNAATQTTATLGFDEYKLSEIVIDGASMSQGTASFSKNGTTAPPMEAPQPAQRRVSLAMTPRFLRRTKWPGP